MGNAGRRAKTRKAAVLALGLLPAHGQTPASHNFAGLRGRGRRQALLEVKGPAATPTPRRALGGRQKAKSMNKESRHDPQRREADWPVGLSPPNVIFPEEANANRLEVQVVAGLGFWQHT